MCTPAVLPLRQNLDDDAVLYGKPLENGAIVTGGVAGPRAAAKLIALLNQLGSVARSIYSIGS